MQALQIVISGLIALGVLVFVHELGHFLVAKIAGIRVEKFSLGFGQKLIGFTLGRTEYLISLLPLGGYVKLAGENPKADEEIKPGDYFSKPWWVRLLVLLAGPAMNILATIFILATLYGIGFMVPIAKPQVTQVEPKSPAILADIQAGDVIIQINQQVVEDWEKFGDQLNELERQHPGQSVVLTIQRKGQTTTRSVKPQRDAGSGQWRLGITIVPAGTNIIDRVFVGTPAELAGLKKGDRVLFIENDAIWTKYDFQTLLWPRAGQPTRIVLERNPGPQRIECVVKPILQQFPGMGKVGVIGVNFKLSNLERLVRYPPGQALLLGYKQSVDMTKMIMLSLWQMATLQISAKDSIGGPITIMRMAGQEARSGVKDFLFFLAGISMMLAIINLLPIPVLDGGNAVFFIFEGILRRPLSIKLQEVFQRAGFTVLVLLMVFATYNDLYKLIAPVFGVKP